MTGITGEVDDVQMGYVLDEIVIVKLPPKTIRFNYPCSETHSPEESTNYTQVLRSNLLNLLGEGAIDDAGNVHYLTSSNVSVECEKQRHDVTIALGAGDEEGVAPFEALLLQVILAGKFQLPDEDLPRGFTECQFAQKPKVIAAAECDARTTTTSSTTSSTTSTSTLSTSTTSTSTSSTTTSTQVCPPLPRSIYYHGEIVVTIGNRKAPDRKRWSGMQCAQECRKEARCQYWLISKQRGCVLKARPDGRVEPSTEFNTFLSHGNKFPLCYTITTTTSSTKTTTTTTTAAAPRIACTPGPRRRGTRAVVPAKESEAGYSCVRPDSEDDPEPLAPP